MLRIPHLRSAALACAGAFCLCAMTAFAQTAPARTVQTIPSGRTANPNNHPHQEPCWQVAGISKSAMERRRAIAQSTRSQVESVCADSALTISQKQQKIRQIREQAKQEEESLVSPTQMQALHACQEQRGHGGGGGSHMGGGHGGGTGPCGELPGNSAPNKNPGSKPEPEPEIEN